MSDEDPQGAGPSFGRRTLHALLRESPHALVVADRAGVVLFASTQAVALLGDDVVGARFVDRLSQGSRALFVDHCDRCLARGDVPGASFGAKVMRADGGEHSIDLRLRTVSTDDGTLVSIALRTPRPQTASDEASARLAAIVNSADDAIYSIGGHGTITTWNAGAERMFGYTADEIIGRHVELMLPPGNQDFTMIRDALARGETVPRLETVRRRKDGTIIDVSLTVGPIYSDGRVAGYSAIARDITESKAAKQRLATTERLAALGTLAASVGHEINNPLAVIVVNLALALERLPDADADLGELLRDSEDAADRIRRIVSDLKSFVRVEQRALEPLDVREVLDRAVRMTSNVVRQHAVLEKRYRDVPAVEADAGRLTQVFTNLLINAYQAVERLGGDGHEIVVSTRTDGIGRAVIEIRDSGPGIEPNTLRRIFDPFFTTKGVGGGTGLGLTVSHNIVASHGGVIDVDSQPGSGAVFRVTLPAARRPIAIANEDTPAVMSRSASRARILLVDDDIDVVRAVARTLEDEHDVTAVHDGHSALEHLAANDYDVVLCDVMMPHMTGMDLQSRVRATRPDIADRFVFMTGGAFTEATTRFLAETRNPCLEKPLTAERIRAVVLRRMAT